MNTRCIVVIGHVDHGKTSLVRALTGIETDRTAEEKARGLSIVTGFAHKKYPHGVIDFIDAPGHEDFIGAMVGATTGAHAALLVVSAVEGVRAQTLEHLVIARLLGLDRGVIAITKNDLVPAQDHATCLENIRVALCDTILADAPMVLCSARTGAGLTPLEQELQTLLALPPQSTAPQHSMLAIDRVFSVSGRGTVVTGTLAGGDLTLDTPLFLQPADRQVSIRGLQSRGQERARVQTGERVAVNLRGVAKDDIARGGVLCSDPARKPSACVDAEISMLGGGRTLLKHMEKIRVLFGTGSEVATVRIIGAGRIGAAQTGFAQLRFHRAVCGFEGQRAILRRLSPPQTLGGAVFLDTLSKPVSGGNRQRLALLRAVKAQSPLQIADALCDAGGGVASTVDVIRLSRHSACEVRAALNGEVQYLDADTFSTNRFFAAQEQALIEGLTTYHRENPLRPLAPHGAISFPETRPLLIKHILGALDENKQLRLHADGCALTSHDPRAHLSTPQHQRLKQIEDAYNHAGLAAADLAKQPFDDDLTALLVDKGDLVSLFNVSLNQTVIVHRRSFQSAAGTLCTAFPPPCEFSTSQARRALCTSRKYIIPVLEYFDTCGITVRNGDLRRMTGAIAVPPLSQVC
ncbi:selenocysteine-specific translation elongation factor [Sulfitobacter sp. F26169L]|uniref:selenocysteine-specific translation elongation factor n=1 Tax=Sulfitobacter sp. F26169L TaxID=2996015 RepID=UPI002260C7B6|nr:selenocysteine-specific translation elongation factor [Sulfitobacter sp. F26169L]MCX7564734.1 selenocysteine-specific translation elongation factor [Sulfitobacter sp. F26169L]